MCKDVCGGQLPTFHWLMYRVDKGYSENRIKIQLCQLFCHLPLPIAAILIASQYSQMESVCYDNDKTYFIDLSKFLYIGGISQLVLAPLLLISIFVKGCPGFICAFINIFLWIWAIIGLIIYCQQMSKECRSEDIGIMILSWSICTLLLTWVMTFGIATFFFLSAWCHGQNRDLHDVSDASEVENMLV